jgi:hypothetical protein
MVMIGVEYHPSFRAIAFCVENTGESGEQERGQSDGQAEKLYRAPRSEESACGWGWRLRIVGW